MDIEYAYDELGVAISYAVLNCSIADEGAVIEYIIPPGAEDLDPSPIVCTSSTSSRGSPPRDYQQVYGPDGITPVSVLRTGSSRMGATRAKSVRMVVPNEAIPDEDIPSYDSWDRRAFDAFQKAKSASVDFDVYIPTDGSNDEFIGSDKYHESPLQTHQQEHQYSLSPDMRVVSRGVLPAVSEDPVREETGEDADPEAGEDEDEAEEAAAFQVRSPIKSLRVVSPLTSQDSADVNDTHDVANFFARSLSMEPEVAEVAARAALEAVRSMSNSRSNSNSNSNCNSAGPSPAAAAAAAAAKSHLSAMDNDLQADTEEKQIAEVDGNGAGAGAGAGAASSEKVGVAPACAGTSVDTEVKLDAALDTASAGEVEAGSLKEADGGVESRAPEAV